MFWVHEQHPNQHDMERDEEHVKSEVPITKGAKAMVALRGRTIPVAVALMEKGCVKARTWLVLLNAQNGSGKGCSTLSQRRVYFWSCRRLCVVVRERG